MNGKKAVIIMAITLTLCFFFSISLLTGDQEEIDILYNSYSRTTQDFRKTSVKTVKNIIDNESNEDSSDSGSGDDSGSNALDPRTWLKICKMVHNSWGGAKFTYVNGGHQQWTDLNNNNITIRTDCSGYVSACLYSAGLTSNPQVHTSQANWAEGVSGVSEVDVGSMQAGDIKVTDGHVEIYAGKGEDGKDKVFNWGGAASAQNKYINVTNPNSVDARSNMGNKQIIRVYRVSMPSSYNGPKINSENMKIYVDAGHGYKSPNTNSTQGRTSGEESWTWFGATYLKKALTDAGFEVHLTSLDDRWNRSNSERGADYANSDCVLMIQVHMNATGDGQGSENYQQLYQSGAMNSMKLGDQKGVMPTTETARGQILCLAHCNGPYQPTNDTEIALRDGIKKYLEEKQNLPIPYKGWMTPDKSYAVTNNCPDKPIILWEVGFGTNAQDRAAMYDETKLTEVCNAFAEALVSAWPD